MKKALYNLREYLLLEKRVLKESRQFVAEQNFFTLQIILLGGVAIFVANFLFSVLSASAAMVGYGQLSIMYLVSASMSAALLVAIKLFPRMNCLFTIYTTYSVAIFYCAFISGVISTSYVSVTILAILFQIPVLFLDKSLRINLFMVFGTAFYLLFISLYKDQSLMIDEVINTISFSVIAMIIGTFARQAKLENISVKEELKRLAYYDALTGIFNRRKLFEDLQHTDNAPGCITAIAMVDVDYFKKYNDTYGHQAGDECLKAIAQCLLGAGAQCDISAYRYGGEEFIVLFHEHSRELVCSVSNDICTRVAAMNREHSSSEQKKVTISMGVCFVQDNSLEKYEAVISRADIALYTAKSQGRNCIVTYSDSLSQPVGQAL